MAFCKQFAAWKKFQIATYVSITAIHLELYISVCLDAVVKALSQNSRLPYIIICNKDGDTCQKLGEQNMHVMLPSKAFQFWTVLFK